MAITTIPYDDLLPYFKGDKKNYFYEQAREKHEAFKPHVDGSFPATLIEERRPNEPADVMAYRKKIWKPITKPTFDRILSSLNKIRRSPDWSVKYPDTAKSFTKIVAEETLEEYCEKKFPFFTSLTNWLFSVALKQQLVDSNGVVIVWPLDKAVDKTTYIRPFPVIFDSCNVVEFVEEEFAIIQDPAGCVYTKGRETIGGKAFYVVNKLAIERWEQENKRGGGEAYNMTAQYEHGLGVMPAFKLGGIICQNNGYSYLYESRISGVLPELDEAVREYSDLQASKVCHVYLERYEFTNQECVTCKGSGQVRNPAWTPGCGSEITPYVNCTACDGGYIVTGPYSKLIIKPQEVGKQPIPTPPIGYVDKSIDIVKVMEESFRNHIFYALAAINFQFLEQTPLNESGKAKEVDKDELNNTVHSIAEDLIRIADNIYKITAIYRYKNLYNIEKIPEMLPSIPVPDKFDLLNTTYLQEDLNKAKTGKSHPVIINAMETDFAAKRFIGEPEIHDMVSLSLKLDPLPNIDEADKSVRLSNKGITQEAYVISSNIYQFIQRAINEDKDFSKRTLPDQLKKMTEYAKEIIEQNSTEAKVVNTTGNGLGPNGEVINENDEQNTGTGNNSNPADQNTNNNNNNPVE